MTIPNIGSFDPGMYQEFRKLMEEPCGISIPEMKNGVPFSGFLDSCIFF